MRKLALILGLTTIMSVSLVGCGSKDAGYEDGTYKGVGEGHGGDIEVSVTVDGGKISAVDVVSQNETEGLADPALEEVPAAIVEKNSTNVDVVAGATYTSEGIMNAVDNALEGK